eukprot:jgi/Astpho2/4794/e_gw1.00067.240.1_t
MWPYHLGLRGKLWLQRRTSSEPHWTEVMEGWTIGGWPASDPWMPPGSPAIVDCTCELPRRHEQLPYFLLPTWDTHGPDPVLIEDAVQWAAQQRRAGHPVFVHCAHGHGRSTVVLCAALVEFGIAKTFEEAFQLIQNERPRVKLNVRQRKALEDWALARTRKL